MPSELKLCLVMKWIVIKVLPPASAFIWYLRECETDILAALLEIKGEECVLCLGELKEEEDMLWILNKVLHNLGLSQPSQVCNFIHYFVLILWCFLSFFTYRFTWVQSLSALEGTSCCLLNFLLRDLRVRRINLSCIHATDAWIL